MMIAILAAALLSRHQINPPGTSVAPVQAAFYSSAGGTMNVEMRDSTGLTIPFVDAIGVKRSSITVTLPAATAVGLGYQITQTKPDSTNAVKAPTGTYSMVITMACTANESPVGTFDGSAGAGNGIAAGYPVPSASSPTAFVNGGTYTIGYGSVISTVSAAKGSPLIAASQLGTISGTYASGVHKIAQIQGENSSGSTVYLQIYDGTSQPAANAVPIAELTVSFGISTAPTSNRLVMTPDYLGTSTGIWWCFVTAPGAFNSANLVSSGSGLLVRCYGQ